MFRLICDYQYNFDENRNFDFLPVAKWHGDLDHNLVNFIDSDDPVEIVRYALNFEIYTNELIRILFNMIEASPSHCTLWYNEDFILLKL